MADHAISDTVTIRVDRFRRWLPQLVAATAEIGCMDVTELVAPCRIGWNVKLRGAIILAAVDVFGKSWSEIGRALGGRNHATMSHAYKTAERLAQHDAEFRKLSQLILAVAREIARRPAMTVEIEPELPL
jgi:hypothetical protein